jgi:hypothetical protein
VLDDRVGDARDVGFLEGVLAEVHGRRLAREHDHRDRVHERGQQAGDRVGGAWTRGDQHDPGAAGRTRVAVGHVRGALLVAREDQLDLAVDQGVEDRHGCAAGKPEDVLDTVLFQAAHQALGARCGWSDAHRLGGGVA